MAKKRPKFNLFHPAVDDILTEKTQFVADDFAPATAEEKASMVGKHKSVSYWRDAARRFRQNHVSMVALVVAFCIPVFRIMGRDYDAAVMGGGFIGFMLGTTANAMAVMRALVERYGPAPRAFLVAPLVGAFFIDFTNALIITGFINFWG